MMTYNKSDTRKDDSDYDGLNSSEGKWSNSSKDADSHSSNQPAQIAAGLCEHSTAKRRGQLGSSFGGVTFKLSSLSSHVRKTDGREFNPEEIDTNQQTKPYIINTLRTVVLDDQDHIFHSTNTHSCMANTGIDRGCACRTGLHKPTNNNTCSACFNNENGTGEQTRISNEQPLESKCAEFGDISNCTCVASRDFCESANRHYQDGQYGDTWCVQTDNIPSAREICASRDSVCVSRFSMGDDHCAKGSANKRSVSTGSDNIHTENNPSRSLENHSLEENFAESGDSPENYLQVCNRLDSYTDCGSRREPYVDSSIQSENCAKWFNSARNSMDSSASMASDNVFLPNHSAMNSLSDITSISSLSSCQSTARDTITSRKRFELRHGNHQDNEGSDYVTPSQRKDKELKDLRKERSQLLREQQEKEVEIAALRACMETLKAQLEEEKVQEMAVLTEKLRVSEKEKFEEMEELCKVQEELSKMDAKYTELKCKLSEKEEKFQEYLFDMYKKGQLAAMFEREEELEMLASSQKSRVSVRELTRKLSRTELELAKWQGLKLEESYSIIERPETQAEATLGFLKDSFFHYLTSKDSEDHLRAMITIFKYSDAQMAKIRKGLEEFKRLDRKRLSLK